MSFKENAVVLALVTMIAAPAPAWSGGVAGCSGLPDIDRAQGVLEGIPSSCDMTVEEARRIVAAQGGPAAVNPRVAPASHASHRSHRLRAPQPY